MGSDELREQERGLCQGVAKKNRRGGGKGQKHQWALPKDKRHQGSTLWGKKNAPLLRTNDNKGEEECICGARGGGMRKKGGNCLIEGQKRQPSTRTARKKVKKEAARHRGYGQKKRPNTIEPCTRDDKSEWSERCSRRNPEDDRRWSE